MTERDEIRPDDLTPELPATIAELLGRPRLTDLPESPVGRTLEGIRAVFGDYRTVELPEIIDLSAAEASVVRAAIYVDPGELHRVDDRRILRYDLTLPLLTTVRWQGEALRLWAEGKVYRSGQTDALHLEAFNQAEALWVDSRDQVDAWRVAARVLRTVEALLPGSTVRIVPTTYPMCVQAWELEVERDGRTSEVLAWGVFTDEIVEQLGADPERHAAAGVGFGLERIAMLRYGIDDIRKIDVAEVA